MTKTNGEKALTTRCFGAGKIMAGHALSKVVEPDAAMATVGLTAERTFLEVARLAFSDIRKLYRADGSLKLPSEWDDDTAAAVSEFRVTELRSGGVVIGRRIRIRMFDKNSALDKVMKHLGLYENDNDQVGNGIARVLMVPPKVRGGHR